MKPPSAFNRFAPEAIPSTRTFAALLVCFLTIGQMLAADLRFNGSIGYSEQPDPTRIGLSVQEVLNRTANSVSGGARIELWAFRIPYSGSLLNGHRLASHVFGVVIGGRSITNINTVTTFIPPPPGRWYTTMMVTESVGSGANDGYAVRDSLNFIQPMVVAPGGAGGRGILVSDLMLTGPASYERVVSDAVVLNAAEVQNGSTVRSGTLRIELWATNRRYTGGELSGHRLAYAPLSPLEAGQSHRNIASRVTFTSPPPGTWQIAMVVSEYHGSTTTNDGFAPVVFTNLDPALTVTAPPPITDDHGNTIATASAIDLNSTVAGRIESAADLDFFRIQIPNPGRLTVFTTGSTDTFGELRDAAGGLIESNDDATDRNFRLSRNLQAGTYYLSVRHFLPASTGDYALRVEFIPDSVPVPEPPPSVPPPAPVLAGRLTNLSVRSTAGSSERTLIVGCVISGNSSKTLLVRGIGPALASFGVTNVLPDPLLQVFSNNTLRSTNDDWGQAANVGSVSQAFIRLGAFPLPSGSRDAAILNSFPAGTCTIQLSGGGSGIALLEVYDSDLDLLSSPSRLTNVSARAHVSAGDGALVAGFTVSGGSRRLLIRGVGPTLRAFGISDALSDPTLRVYSGSTLVTSVDDWSSRPEQGEIQAVSRAVGAFPLTSGLDAALLVTLQPGSYTAHVTGFLGLTGVALIEIYEVD